MSELTIIVKTFQRPASLMAFLNSVRMFAGQFPVLVADDSRVTSKNSVLTQYKDLNIEYLELPFDSGLSAGRNALLEAVRTPFFLLCDDDYVFERRTDIDFALETMKRSKADIVGGEYYNYVSIPSFGVFIRQLSHPYRLFRFFFRRYQRSAYVGNFGISGRDCVLIVNKRVKGIGPVKCDLVNNFFVARTQKIRQMGGWDVALKMGEHEDFFLRAKLAGLITLFLPGFGTGHFPAIPVKNSDYNKYRVRAAGYKQMFIRKFDFRSYLEKEAETGKILFSSNEN